MIEVNLLGSVTLLQDGVPFRLERRAQRLLMGLLALDAGRCVSSSHLIEMLWGANAPASARATLHTRISELRSLLNRQGLGDGAVELRSVETGYRLEINPDQVDGHRFLKLVGGWRRLPRAQDSLDRLAGALALWRGPVFGGLLPEATSAAAEALTAARLTALEDYFALNLHLGNDLQVVDRLTEAARQTPTRERLTALCMIALTRAGRAAEALTMYANWRAWLREELGTDPGAEVQQVYLAIVRGDDLAESAVLGPHPFPVLASDASKGAQPVVVPASPTIAAGGTGGTGIGSAIGAGGTGGADNAGGGAGVDQPAGASDHRGRIQPSVPSLAAVPRTLPPPVDGFTGRDAETARLVELVSGADQRLIAVSGAAGAGKTALTVHAAHLVADRFPDGQLFADLRGYDEQHPPETACGVLGRLLRALGVPTDAVPEQLDDRVDCYRQLLAGRRMLVVLDNVAGDEQVAPLLAAGDTCRIVLTGRTRLGAASGAAQLVVRPMNDAEGASLLRRIAGDGRVDDDPRGAAELVRRCGNLPLAVRIAGAKLATKPHWSIAHLLELLAADETRLSYLTHQQLSVASGIAVSCGKLSAPALRLLELTGTLDGPDIPVWVAAALLDADPRIAECALEELFDANLADVTDGGGPRSPHYRISTLVWDFARERAAAALGPAQLREARQRLREARLSMVEAAHPQLYGGNCLTIGSSLLQPADAYDEYDEYDEYAVEGYAVGDLLAGSAARFDREFATLTAQPACTVTSR